MADPAPAWDDLRLLLEVHRRGSLKAAGEAVGLSTSTLSRRLADLERALSQRLLRRTSQGTWVDEDGLGLVALAEEIERSLAAYRRDGAGLSPYAGGVAVSVPDGFVSVGVRAAERARGEHPEITVEISAEPRFVDLANREADVGLRGGRSSSSVLIERPVGEVRSGLFASADYLQRRLPSRALPAQGWGEQDFIAGSASHGPNAWLKDRGARRFPVVVDTYEGRLEAAERGLGLVMAGVETAAQRPGLLRVRLAEPLPAIPFYLVMHQELRKVPRVRAVADALAAVVAEEIAAQERAEEAFRSPTT